VIDAVTHDRLLGGRVLLRQPRAGYRVAMDPVLLAAAVPAQEGDRVLDAGAGTGAAALCLATRVPGCRVIGVELQIGLRAIATANVADNGLSGRVEILLGDLVHAKCLTRESFDHVMTNPPHLAAATATPPPGDERARAHIETVPLAAWLEACVRLLKPGGMLTLIHRTERLAEILAAVTDALGDVTIFPLWPGDSAKPAKRVLVQGRKGSRAPLVLAAGLVLHEAFRLSPAAEAVLRHGEALVLRGGQGARVHA